MKSKGVSLLIVLVLSWVFSADTFSVKKVDEEEITLKYDIKDDLLRIVLQTTTDRYVQNAKVRSTYSLVKIQFPGDFILNTPTDTGGRFEYSKKLSNLYLNVRDLKWIKILRLKSPPRLVIDAYLHGIEKERRQPEEVPEVEMPRPKGEIKTVVVDPGHGGTEIGIYSPGFVEKKVVLRVAWELSRRLKGTRAYLTRTSDRRVSLMKRILFGRAKDPDIFISLHLTTTNSVNIFTASERYLRDKEPLLLSASQMRYLQESKKLARALGEELQNVLGIEVRYLEAPLPVLTHMDSPAVLIELPSGEFFEYNLKNIKEIAEAIKRGMERYESS